MKKLILAALACLLTQEVMAARLDLSPTVMPVLARELHDGQYLAGIMKPNILIQDFGHGFTGQIGIMQLWNAEHGNASLCIVPSISLPMDLGGAIGAVGSGIGLPETFKPAAFMGSMVNFGIFAGYRPIHTIDVIGDFVYGFSIGLNVKFGVQELRGI